MSDQDEGIFGTADVYVDETRDITTLSGPLAAVVDHMIRRPGRRFGLVRDGLVVGVLVDRVDASIYEHLHVRYQDQPGEHQQREPRVSPDTIANERRAAEQP
jgi:hypothetical protein